MKYRILDRGIYVWPDIAMDKLGDTTCKSKRDGKFETSNINLAFQYLNLLTPIYKGSTFNIVEVEEI